MRVNPVLLEPFDRTFLVAGAAIVVMAAIALGVAIRRDAQRALRRAARAPRWPFETATPARIRLAMVASGLVAWEDLDAVEEQYRQLRDLGFTYAGTYTVEDLDGLRLEGFVRPEEGLRAVVGERGETGVFVEVIARHEDGRKFVLSNVDRRGETAWPPGSIIENYPGLDARGLTFRMREVRPEGVPTVVDVGGFAADYERGYAELRDWRNLRGGLDEREVRSIAAADGDEPSDEWVEHALRQEAHRAAMGLSEAAFHRFFAETEVDDLTRYRLSQRIIIIHDRLPIESVAEVFHLSVAEADGKIAEASRVGLHDDDLDRPVPLAMCAPRQAFVALNDLLPPGRRFRKVGGVAEPIATDLYAPRGI